MTEIQTPSNQVLNLDSHRKQSGGRLISVKYERSNKRTQTAYANENQQTYGLSTESDQLNSNLTNQNKVGRRKNKNIQLATHQFLQHNQEEVELQIKSQEGSQMFSGFTQPVWRDKGFYIVFYVLRFIGSITKANFADKFRLMKREIFHLIDDKATDFDYYKFNNYLKYEQPSIIQSRLRWISMNLILPIKRTRIYLLVSRVVHKMDFHLYPEQKIMVLWNIYILIVLTINIFYVALRWSFPTGNVRHQQTYVELICDAAPNYSFLLEIVLKFNTCYYERGNLIKDRLKIARFYLKSNFWLDVIVVLPFFITFLVNLNYFDLLIVLKILQIQKLADNLFSRLELTSNQIAAFDLFKLVYMIILVAHFCACLWFIIGQYGLDQDMCWIRSKDLVDASWQDLYVFRSAIYQFTSYYWSIITMTTIGYGDIVPMNTLEKQFVSVMILISCGVFAYSINNIGNIFGELSKKSNHFRTEMNTLKKYLRTKGIHSSLQEKIRRYFEFIWSEDNDEDHEEEYKFEKLIPTQLKEEMAIEINLKRLRKVSFLHKNFSEEFLIQISKHFKERRFGPEEIIFQQGKPADAFYILISGQVSKIITLQNQIVKHIDILNKDSAVFGHLDFFMDRCHQTTAKSTQVSYILEISRKRMAKIFEHFPADFVKYNLNVKQRFCNMRDLIQLSNKYDVIGVSCKSCGKPNHMIQQCPLIMGLPNRAKVLLNHRRVVPNDRRWIERNNEWRRFHSLGEQINLQENVINFLLGDVEYADQLNEIKECIYPSTIIRVKRNHKSCQRCLTPCISKPLSKRRVSIFSLSNDQASNNVNKWSLARQQRSQLREIKKTAFSRMGSTQPKEFYEQLQDLKPSLVSFRTNIGRGITISLPKSMIKEDQVGDELGTMPIDSPNMYENLIPPSVPIQSCIPLDILSIEEHNIPHVNFKKPSQFEFSMPESNYNSPALQEQTRSKRQTLHIKQQEKEPGRNSRARKRDSDSFLENPEEKPLKIRGQFIEIYRGFESVRNYDNYFVEFNIDHIMNSTKRFKDIKAQSQALKRQHTIINLLTQKRSRLSTKKL